MYHGYRNRSDIACAERHAWDQLETWLSQHGYAHAYSDVLPLRGKCVTAQRLADDEACGKDIAALYNLKKEP